MPDTNLSDFLIYRKFKRKYSHITRANGIYLYDEEGKRYIDGLGGSIVVSIGYSVPEVLEAMNQQASQMTFIPPTHFISEAQEQLASSVCLLTPGDLKKAWFVSSGSEATEAAVKLARQYHLENGRGSKYLVISRWGSYHGTTLGSLGYGGHTNRRRKYLPLVINSPHIPPVYCYRCPYDKVYPNCNLCCAYALEKTIRQEGPENVSAFIAEPVVGSTLGAVPPPPEYFPIISEICKRYGVLFIADEVLTGFGRTGRNFAVDHWNVVPDIMALGKGMASGYIPLAGIVAREQIINSLWERGIDFASGGTYSGNPLSCATGVAVLNYMNKYNLVKKAQESGDELFNQIKILKKHQIVGDVRGLGLLIAIEFVNDRANRTPFPAEFGIANLISEEAFQLGLIIGAGTGMVDGVLGDTIRLGPPFIITHDEIHTVVSILDQAISIVENRISA